MKILITGGAGFVGSHLADKFIGQGHEITVIDDLSTGRYSNVEHLEGNSNFRLIIDTVLNEKLMEELVRETDHVYHMASAVGVKLIMDHPVKTIETIFRGTDVVLGFCSRYRKRVLIPSTSEVYGKSATVPFREDDDLLTGPTAKHRWAYACAKTLDEFLALAHWKETRLPVVVVRLFNTVGPRQTGQYGMVVPRFVEAALKNETIEVHGDGTQSRCFGHVHDIVEGLSKLLDNTQCFGQVINVGNDEEVTIKQLADRAIKLTGSRSEIRFVPYSEAYGEGFEDMQRRVPSLEKAERLIGYKPTRTLDDIINDVASEIRKGLPLQSKMLKDNLRKYALVLSALLVCLVSLASAQTGGLKGKVRTNSGNGIANASVTVRKDGKDLKSVNANSGGNFVIEGIEPGSYNLVVDAKGYASALHGVEVKKNKVRDLGDRLMLNIDQGSQVILQGSVFFREGTSVTGAKVEVERINADGSTSRVGTMRTNIRGEFTIRQPDEPAKYRVTATYNGVSGTKEIQADNAAVYRLAITLDISRSDK